MQKPFSRKAAKGAKASNIRIVSRRGAERNNITSGGEAGFTMKGMKSMKGTTVP
jgi:hypothetical protein